MNVTPRFFAQFRERFGPIHALSAPDGVRPMEVPQKIAARAHDGEAALFAPDGRLCDHVIVMQSPERIENNPAATDELRARDRIAVFPPVAGG